ncbi:MAG: DUF3631 domain-containing protein [Streptosporangiaceae bacterium]|jgi:hypothetical protein
MTTGPDDSTEDQLSRGEPVPGGPGACDRPGCAHLTLWHGEHGRYRGKPCRQCHCPAYVPQPEGAAILRQLHAIVTRYVILPSAEAAVAVTLWTAASHAQAAWQHAPRLVIRAPEKRCGKSRLLDIVEGTCHHPLITVNASPAAVYRAIGTGTPPTLLVDEADTIFGGKNAEANEDLRGLLNAGHQRNRPAIRWDAGTRSLETIPTFAMAALAGIGAMPDTIEDRAVVIRMRRRAPGESVAPFRHRRDRPALTSIAAQLDRWLGRHLAELEKAEPPMPLEDRAADTWEPLIAVADLAGGRWPALARHAAIVLTADHDQAASVSDRIRLLADCRAAFGDADALPTTTLITRLRSDPEAPWSEHGPAGITPMRLGAMLRDYDIRSGNIRFGEPIGQVKGYYRADFTDAWARYCPSGRGEPSQPSQPSPPSSAPGRLETWDGSSRPTQKAVPGLTCDGTTGTAGTATPRFGVIDGGAA